ncbi:MAG: helix-turn-helix domain-containing protein [Paracoccaceae bacterium]
MTGRSDTPDAPKGDTPLKGFDDFELSLGDIMRGERATMGKSLLDVQRELKIKATYISAIENTDPSAFDTPGFVAGYVRSYARYLGLDPEWAFKTFCEEGNFEVAHGMSPDARVRSDRAPGVKKSKTNSQKPAHLRDPFTEPSVSYLPKGEAALSRLDPRALMSIAVLLALLAGIGYGGWAVLQEVQKVRLTPVEQTPEVLAELDPLADAIRPDPVATPGASGIDTPAADRLSRLSRPDALDIPVLVARDGPIAAIDPDTIGALAPSRDEGFIAARNPRPDNLPFAIPGNSVDDVLAAAVGEIGPPAPPVQVIEEADPSVTLFAVRPSWVRVRGADGTVIFEKILDAGERFEVPVTEEPPTLRAGNANALFVSIGSQTYGPIGTGPEVVKGVVLAAEPLRDSYTVANPDDDRDLARFIDVAEAQADQ